MTISVFIVASAKINKHIQDLLEPRAGLEAREFTSGLNALAAARHAKIDIAILDADSRDLPAGELGATLRSWHPQIRIALLQAINPARQKSLSGFKPDVVIEAVDNDAALLDFLDRFHSPSGVEDHPAGRSRQEGTNRPARLDKPAARQEFPWFSDADRMAPLLAQHLLESGAEALLVTRAGAVWAYAGGFQQQLIEELAGAVEHYWRGPDGGDLARFIRLQASGDEVMLFATPLIGDMVLALVFPAKTQFSKIRRQTAATVQALLNQPLGQFAAEAAPLPEQKDVKSSTGPRVRTSTAPIELQPWPELEDTGSSLSLNFQEHTASPQVPALSAEERVPKISMPGLPRAPMPYEVPSTVEADLADELPAQAGTALPFADWTVQETHLDAASASVYKLTYACVILPRLPHHLLTSNLTRMLNEWVPQICIAFGWRVEQIAIRPEYAQFMIDVPPETSPQSLMQIIQRVTSQRIFSAFPTFRQENPSGDFWAPGYMIIGSSELPPAHMVQQFISQTRTRQGLA